MKLHQKKFYSSEETDRAIGQHARENDMGYSEALRDIVRIQKVGVIKDGKVEFNEYWNTSEGAAEIAGRGQ